VNELAMLAEGLGVDIWEVIDAAASKPFLSCSRKNLDPPAQPSSLVARASGRVRTGDYRFVYEIEDEQPLVLVLRIAHRREIYQKR